MANVQKYNKAAVGHMFAHYERKEVPAKDEKGNIKTDENGAVVMEYVKFGNQDIDTTRTHLNYNMAPEREGGQLGFLHHRLSEVHHMNRADVNVMCSWVLTLPSVNADGEKMEYTPDEEYIYFKECYDFLAARYGEDNIISAYVHKDENHPHMHFAFIPVTVDKKHDRLKLAAKLVVSQTELRAFHPSLQKHLDERCGEGKYPVLNGATDGGNRTINELKAARAAEQAAESEARAEIMNEACQDMTRAAEEAEAKKEEMERELPALSAQISDAKAEKEAVKKEKAEAEQQKQDALQSAQDALRAEKEARDRLRDLSDDITDLEARKAKIMTSGEVLGVEATKTILGGTVKVKADEWERVKSTAQHVDAVREGYWQLKAENEELKSENAGLKQEVSKLQNLLAVWKRIAEEFVEVLKEHFSLEKVEAFVDRVNRRSKMTPEQVKREKEGVSKEKLFGPARKQPQAQGREGR